MYAREGLLLLAAATMTAGCAPLDPLDVGECGNGAVEAGEDCEPGGPWRCVAQGQIDECRIRCASAAECPADMVCGLEGLCLRHAGTFSTTSSIEVRADTLLGTADMDGDGARDLLVTGTGLFGVAHVSRVGAVESVVRFPAAPALPVAAHLSEGSGVGGEPVDDLALGYGGLFVQRGSPSRLYGPVTYSPVPVPSSPDLAIAIFDALPPASRTSDGALIHLGDEVVATNATDVWTLEEDTLTWEPSSWPDASAGARRPLLVADLVPRPPGLDCDEILTASESAGRLLEVISPCGDATGATPQAFSLTALANATIAMPANCGADRGVVATHVNGDADLDVLVASDCAAPSGGIPDAGQCTANEPLSAQHDGPSLWVAYWSPEPDGGGRFTGQDPLGDGPADPPGCSVAAVPNPSLDAILATAAQTAGSADNALLLGAADFNADGLPDLVLVDGSIALSLVTDTPGLASAQYLHVRYSSNGAWDFAELADFDGNGIADVVAGAADRPELVLLSGSPAGAPVEVHVPLLGPPSHAVVGDFDGDQLPDLAFAELGPPDVLAICYGEPFGGLSDPVRVGALGTVRQITQGNLSVGGLDGIDDLIVISTQGSGTDSAASLAMLLGSPDRMPFSPMFFTRGSAVDVAAESPAPALDFGWSPAYDVDLGFVATNVVAGQIDGDGAGHPDVAVLTRPGSRLAADWAGWPDHQLWLFPMTGDAAIDVRTVAATGFGASLPLLGEGARLDRALLATLDLGGPPSAEGEPMNEVVVLATDVTDAADLTQVRGAILVTTPQPVTDDSATGAARLALQAVQQITDLDLLFWRPDLSAGSAATDGIGAARGGQVEVGDVTGDGRADLVVLAGRAETRPDGPAQLRAVVVALPNLDAADLAHSLDPAARIELSRGLPTSSGGAETDDPTSFALRQLDLDPELEVVLATRKGLYVANRAADDPARWDVAALTEPGGGVALEGGTSLAFGDFNGDHLHDLAVVRPRGDDSAYASLAVLLGMPAE